MHDMMMLASQHAYVGQVASEKCHCKIWLISWIYNVG